MVLQIRDLVGEARYRFRPVVHLRTGRAMALEVRACPAGGELDHLRSVTGIAERLVHMDVTFAAQAARRAADYESVLPLHLFLWAATACAPRDPLGPLLDAVADIGRTPGQVVVRLVVPDGEPAPADLGTGLARLRAAGFGVGLDAAGTYPMETLIEARPEVLLLAAKHTAGLPATPDARAALAGCAELAGRTGSTLIADGCDTAEQAEALRSRGAYLVQGELLGPAHRRPLTQPIPAVILDRLTTPEGTGPGAPSTRPAPAAAAAAEATGRIMAVELAHPAATMLSDTTAEAACALFADRPELTGAVVVDGKHRPLACLNRDRFMLAITGPFGYALHARRPAVELGEPPRTLGPKASLAEAIELVAETPVQRMSDDIVLLDYIGRCQGVLRIGDLVRDLAHRQATFPAAPGVLGREHSSR
ncbi:MAG TPA: EAL domain-containing protein [Pseudonocardiaceae bacterium]